MMSPIISLLPCLAEHVTDDFPGPALPPRCMGTYRPYTSPALLSPAGEEAHPSTKRCATFSCKLMKLARFRY